MGFEECSKVKTETLLFNYDSSLRCYQWNSYGIFSHSQYNRRRKFGLESDEKIDFLLWIEISLNSQKWWHHNQISRSNQIDIFWGFSSMVIYSKSIYHSHKIHRKSRSRTKSWTKSFSTQTKRFLLNWNESQQCFNPFDMIDRYDNHLDYHHSLWCCRTGFDWLTSRITVESLELSSRINLIIRYHWCFNFFRCFFSRKKNSFSI